MPSRRCAEEAGSVRIVIDTNVVASAVFFGGRPGELLDLLLHRRLEAVATDRIVAEYQATVDYLLARYGEGQMRLSLLPVVAAMDLIPQTEDIHICRDPDDDKFISCAVDGGCIYIVSGDKDLLSVGQYDGVEILTVAQFLEQYHARLKARHDDIDGQS